MLLPHDLAFKIAVEKERRKRKGSPTNVFTRLSLYPKQAAIVDDPARFTITEATTKAGKTLSHIEWLLEQAAKSQRGNRWWIAPVSDVADIAFRRTQERLRGFIDSGGQLIKVAEPIPFGKNETRKIIEVFGTAIWFKSGDRPDSLYGEDVYNAVFDEFTRARSEAWDAVYTTLSATKGRAKLIGNVKGRRNWGYMLARRAEAGLSDWSYHKLTAYDAIEGGVLEHDIVEQAKRDLPEAVYKELYLAEAADDEGNPFGLEAIRKCVILAQSPRSPAVFGVDLAKSHDWTWIIGLDDNGQECFSERFQRDWGFTRQRVLDVIGTVPTLIDSTGVGDPIVEDLQRARSNVTGFKYTGTSKQQLMEGLAVAIQRQELGIHDARLIAELEAFEYQYTRSGVRYTAPEGLHDDGVNALALAKRMLSAPKQTTASDSMATMAVMARMKNRRVGA